MKIAYIIYKDMGAFASPTAENEDDTLLKFLIEKGINIEKVIWNEPNIEWDNYNLAILKSPWDYFDLIEDFYTWLNLLKSKNIRLLNPIDIVKWNADKHYLLDIEEAGLNVAKSIFIKKGDEINLDNYFKILNTEQFIVKPCVSGGSKNTFKVNLENVKEINERVKLLTAKEDFIIQPFINEIETEGEWSFIFFGGKFSHCLLKKAKNGDFRVQHYLGGTIHPQKAPANLLKSAQQYVNQFAKKCLYARVDGTLVKGNFVLMELELIEPFLFLNTNQDSYENYYQALKTLI
jgi:glutathione synthase/RimK-type ligase-like ATP-grasp enzyme